jgi:uridine kinase
VPRNLILGRIQEEILSLRADHTIRVGIDGVGASGKTTLADELAARLEAAGREVVRATIDGFHHPRPHRIRRGADSVEGYYHDSFNYPAVCEAILHPLGPDGAGEFRRAVYDFRVEQHVDSPVETVGPGAILIFDGMFLFRQELAEHWDYRVFVHADFHVTLNRAIERDLTLFGSEAEIRRRYQARYIPGQTLYLDTVRPFDIADAVVHNNIPQTPTAHFASDAGNPEGIDT